MTTNYSLIGTAFDYLLRFYLERINKNSKTSKWVSYLSLDLIEDGRLKDNISKLIKNAEKNYQKYLDDGMLNDELLKSCIHLAQIDIIFRAGIVDENIGLCDSSNIQDLRNLYALLKKDDFKADVCILNPTFGEASLLVGGADADIIINNSIIDIKTTKKIELTKDYLNQIVGYYVLYRIGGINNEKNIKIDNVGIYFSRYGFLYKMPIKEVLNLGDIGSLIEWFKKRAKKEGYDYEKIINNLSKKWNKK